MAQGKINFYLEALDRNVKKPNENPSVGLILCASKDDTVVEYALSRSLSPTTYAESKQKSVGAADTSAPIYSGSSRTPTPTIIYNLR